MSKHKIHAAIWKKKGFTRLFGVPWKTKNTSYCSYELTGWVHLLITKRIINIKWWSGSVSTSIKAVFCHVADLDDSCVYCHNAITVPWVWILRKFIYCALQIHLKSDCALLRKKTKQKADSTIWKKTDHIGSVAAGETTRQLKQCTLGRWDQRWRLAMMLDTTFGKNQTRHIRTNTVYQLSSTAVSSDDLGLLCTYNADQELCVPNYSRFECEPISLKLGKW